MAKNNTSSSPEQQATDSLPTIDSAVTIQEKPQYMAGFPDSAATDTAVARMSALPVIERPKPLPSSAHGHATLHDTGSMSLLMAAVLMVMFSYRNGYKYVQNFFHYMFSTRRRENLFEDHTVNETQILGALIFCTCVVEGLLMYLAMCTWMPAVGAAMSKTVFPHVVLFTGMALVFYLVQLGVYWLLGYVFSDTVGTKLWLDGFRSTQSLLGLLLLPVLCVSLVAGNWVEEMLICAIILYFCARIVFICKGFRIFYSKLPSLVYFILYLCAAEIVPLFIMGASTVFLSQLLRQFLNV